MKRAAIYARFSTELQRDQSIEDQVALCQTYAGREGLAVVEIYADRARSGASIFGRDGLEAMLKAAEAREFDCIVVEALDRLSRDMADLAGMHRRLSFLGVELRAVHDGIADTVTIGLRGLVGQLFREDGAKKVKRGMAGVIRDGRHAGGRAYGYRPTPGEPGRLQIVDAEAEIVRRIFAEYAEGKSPRDIAADLNRDQVPPPRGSAWNASTINGDASRANGIIRNPVYGGEIVWNRVRMVKDPSTGRRVSRPNPQSEWIRQEAPELAIVDRATLVAAVSRKDATARAPAIYGPRKAKRSPLSGLLKCSVCGSGMAKHDVSAGRPRIRCSRATESRSCDNRRPVYLDRIEVDVVDSLAAELRHPDLIVEYVRTYHAERQRLAGSQSRRRAKLEVRLSDLDREMEKCVDAIATGASLFPQIRARMEKIEAERQATIAELAEQPAANTIALHPKAVDEFAKALADLKTALAAKEENALAHASFRRLVERVVVSPAELGEKPAIKIIGRLAAIMDLKGLGSPLAATGTLGGSRVAEVRYVETPQLLGPRISLAWAAAA